MTCNPINAAERARRRRPLSQRQDQVLRALVMFTARHRRQPSYRELATAIGGGTSIHKYLVELEAKGWIGLGGGPRGIDIPADVYDSIVETGEPPTADAITEE